MQQLFIASIPLFFSCFLLQKFLLEKKVQNLTCVISIVIIVNYLDLSIVVA